MKFAHLADIHLGSWREPALRALNTKTFFQAIDVCRAEKVDFILIAGDLFNTALPAIDILNSVTREFRILKEEHIPVYTIPGSHDFSASGKTMIDVLESAGLLINVCKGDVINQKLRLRFTIDQKTGAKITGMLGKKGMLDRAYYEDLDRDALEAEPGTKLFLFHTALTELKPKDLEKMESYPLSLLPKGFEYYAGGHVHHRMEYTSDTHKLVTQPGALFPNNFAELEKYGHGGFFIFTDGKIEWRPIKIKDCLPIHIDCESKTSEEVHQRSIEEVDKKIVKDRLILLRFSGKLKSSKVSDIKFNELFEYIYRMGAYIVMRNTTALTSEEFEEIKVQTDSVENIEETLIAEHAQQVSIGVDREQEIILTKKLMAALITEKKEGENTHDFEERIRKEAMQVLKIDNG